MTLQEYVDALRGKRVAVLGIGVSNTPLIDLLLDNGLPITVCDMRDESAMEDEAEGFYPHAAQSSGSAPVIWTVWTALT